MSEFKNRVDALFQDDEIDEFKAAYNDLLKLKMNEKELIEMTKDNNTREVKELQAVDTAVGARKTFFQIRGWSIQKFWNKLHEAITNRRAQENAKPTPEVVEFYQKAKEFMEDPDEDMMFLDAFIDTQVIPSQFLGKVQLCFKNAKQRTQFKKAKEKTIQATGDGETKRLDELATIFEVAWDAVTENNE